MQLHHLPNIVTGLRILLTFPIIWFLVRDEYVIATSLIIIAGVSDALDGYLARRYGWESELGAMLDPLADKLFLAALIIVLGLKQLIPLWLVVCIISRDVVILVGAIIYQWFTHDLMMSPLLISKLNTALLVVLVSMVSFSRLILVIPDWILQFMTWAVALTTITSGLAYIIIWTCYACKYQAGGNK